MAKITRATQKIFAGDIVATNNIAVFGSLKAGAPNYSNDPSTIQSLTAFTYGWGSAVVNNNAPALQDVNAVDYLYSRQIAYIMQQGICEWDSGTEYALDSYAQVSGVIYRSLQNTNLNHLVTDLSWWTPLLANALSGTVSSSTSGTIGTSNQAARQDHNHHLGIHSHQGDSTGGASLWSNSIGGTVSSSTSGSSGFSNQGARYDHNHNLGAHTHTDATNGGSIWASVVSGTVSSSTSGIVGTATTAARQDHNHHLGAHTHTDATNGGLIVAASATQQGAVTTGAQTFAGAKTFNGYISAGTSNKGVIGSCPLFGVNKYTGTAGATGVFNLQHGLGDQNRVKGILYSYTNSGGVYLVSFPSPSFSVNGTYISFNATIGDQFTMYVFFEG